MRPQGSAFEMPGSRRAPHPQRICTTRGDGPSSSRRIPGYEDVVPDFERINPEYFQVMDRKIDYLDAEGFIPFIEVTRRDVTTAWRAFYDWPESYARYVQYVSAATRRMPVS